MNLLSVQFWTELVDVSIGIVCCRYTVRLLVNLTVWRFSSIVFLIFFFFGWAERGWYIGTMIGPLSWTKQLPFLSSFYLIQQEPLQLSWSH